MTARLAVAALAAFLAVLPGAARADEPSLGTWAEVMPNPRDGRPGIWLELSIARDALDALEAQPDDREEIETQAERIRLLLREVDTIRRAERLVLRQRDELQVSLTATVRRAREAEERASAWYRAPIFWMALGVVSGAGFALLMAGALGGS